MVAPNTQKLTAVFLYSRKDEAFRERFGDYLRLLQSDDYLLGLTFQDIESLSPYRFRDKVESSDFFLFAGSPHLFAHPNMNHPVFKRLVSYHHTGRLRAIALNCRPWAIEDTLLKSVIQLPGNGEPLSISGEETKDEAFLDIYHYLCQLCEDWMEEKSRLENSWKLAQRNHDVEAYHAFLKQYPHSRYSGEARNLADNLSEAEMWAKASEKKSLQHYFGYLLSPSQQRERQDEAARKITEIEEDEERFWADTATQKGPEFFIRYKAMFPEGKHWEEADKKLRKLLKRPAALAVSHAKASEHHYLMHLAYKRLPEEEYFALNSHLLYCMNLRGRHGKVVNDVKWRGYLYPSMLGLALLALAIFSWPSISETLQTPSVSGALLTVAIVLFAGILAYRSFHSLRRLYEDYFKLQEALQALKQSAAYLKVGYLTNDPKTVWEIQLQLIRLEQQLQAIEQKNVLDYFFQAGPDRPEWVVREEAA